MSFLLNDAGTKALYIYGHSLPLAAIAKNTGSFAQLTAQIEARVVPCCHVHAVLRAKVRDLVCDGHVSMW